MTYFLVPYHYDYNISVAMTNVDDNKIERSLKQQHNGIKINTMVMAVYQITMMYTSISTQHISTNAVSVVVVGSGLKSRSLLAIDSKLYLFQMSWILQMLEITHLHSPKRPVLWRLSPAMSLARR